VFARDPISALLNLLIAVDLSIESLCDQSLDDFVIVGKILLDFRTYSAV
jgi:hypothetical protein